MKLAAQVFPIHFWGLLAATLAIGCASPGSAQQSTNHPKNNTRNKSILWQDLPTSLRPFRRSLIEREPRAACQYLSFPVTLYEVAYEPRESGESYMKTSSLANCSMALSALGRLKKFWEVSTTTSGLSSNTRTFANKPMFKPCSVRWSGISVVGDVEHFYAVGLTPANSKIRFIIVDAQDNIWRPSRQEFQKIYPGRMCRLTGVQGSFAHTWVEAPTSTFASRLLNWF